MLYRKQFKEQNTKSASSALSVERKPYGFYAHAEMILLLFCQAFRERVDM